VTQSDEVVYLVDDDASIREAIADLLETQDLAVVTFDSAESFPRRRVQYLNSRDPCRQRIFDLADTATRRTWLPSH
jgi:FixJ family two-component response regulator